MKSPKFIFKLWFDRLLSKSLWEQFLIVLGVLVVALGLSYLILPIWSDNWQKVCEDQKVSIWLLPIYLLIDSNALNALYDHNLVISAWTLIASSSVFLFGALVFNGLVIGIITNSIERRVTNHNEGHIHYLKSGHHIIMGYDDMVPSIIADIFEKDKDAFVLLLSASKAEDIREELRKVFSEETIKRIIINNGHRTSAEYYKDIHLESAAQVFIVGKRESTSHDAKNVECVDCICSYLHQSGITDRPRRITCVFEDLDTYAAFKTSEIFKDVSELGIEFIPYNFYAGWAKQVFVNRTHKMIDHPGEVVKYPAVFGKGHFTDDKALTVADPRYVHLVFVGTTNFAVAFAMEAAQVLHFPNGKTVKTLITFIDKNADVEKDEFIVRNRHFFEVQSYYYSDLTGKSEYGIKEVRLVDKSLEFEGKQANFLDVEFEFIKGDVFSAKVQKLISGWANEHNTKQYLSIFLAISKQRQNFVMGMNMPDAVYDNEVPIFIRQDRSDNFVSDLRNADEAERKNPKTNTYYYVDEGKLETKTLGGRYANIYPFGMIDTAYTADNKSLKRAKLVNYLYSTMSGNTFQSLLVLKSMSSEQIWKEADGYWNGLSVALKWSNLYNAYSMRIKLAVLRSMRGLAIDDTTLDRLPLSDEEVEILAEVEHNRWNVEKLLMGFRKPKPEEDKYVHEKYANKLKLNKNRFIHHDIRPFKGLDEVRQLDEEFSRYIPWILEMTEE